jgi:hypothetical protein
LNDPALLADLVRAGLAPDLVARVAVAIETMSRNVPDNVPDNIRDTVRKYERERKRKLRKSSGKQTMSASFKRNNVPDNVPDNGENHCDTSSSSFLSSTATTSSDSKRSKEEKSLLRGTRMQHGSVIRPDDWQFAHDRGYSDTEITALWSEFVDYWIGVPGQRGLKLDWSATWRNRVRQVSAGRRGNGTGNTTMAAFDKLIARAEEIEGDGSPPMRDITP